MARADLDREIDALFRLPLSEFTSARNALAARLRKEKRAIDAERVKSLPKPPAPAWAVNQLYWENPKAIDRLIAVSERVRKVQTGRIKNVDVRELLGDKRRMTVELVERAATTLRAAGHAVSPDALRRVSATLESLAVWGNAEGAPTAGRLTADLDPPGFEALAAVMGGAKFDSANVLAFRPPKPKPVEDATAVRAREAVQAAEKELEAARREAAAAEEVLEKANANYAEAKEEVRRASVEAKKAAAAVARAEKALTGAHRGK